MLFRKLAVVVLALECFAVSLAPAADESSEAAKRLNAAVSSLDEIAKADRGIPEEILGSAKCLALAPSVVKTGFIFSGRRGRGFTTCRTTSGWSAPAPFIIAGGNWGQTGSEPMDLVMLAMTEKGMTKLLENKFKLGGDASAAAGPVGRHLEAKSKPESDILTYARNRGSVAGIAANGALVTQDSEAARTLYGKTVSSSDILKGQVQPSEGSRAFIAAVSKYTNQSEAEVLQRQEAKTAPASDSGARMLTSAEAQSAILDKLKSEPGLDSSKVSVVLTADTVKLSGSVRSAEDQVKVARIVKSYAGDRELQNQLSIEAK
jgi:lipid-binding SYLF domain-containing protein